MPSLAREVIGFSAPVSVRDQTVREVTITEPTVRDYLDLGPVYVRHHNRKGLVAELARPGLLRLYLGRCTPGLNAAARTDLLAALSLADALRIQRVIERTVPTIPRDDVEAYQAAVAFEWRLMSIREADAMGVSEFFDTVERLGAHCERRQKQAKR